MRKTKIVATFGPQWRSPDLLRSLLSAGVDVVRINASHEELGQARLDINLVRSLARELGKSVGIMLDLQGPRLRVGKLPDEGLNLEPGTRVSLVAGGARAELSSGTRPVIPVEHPEIIDAVEPGARVLLSDGEIELVARERRLSELICEVKVGGLLLSHRGINLPDSTVVLPLLTELDKAFVEVAAKEGVDWVALSFVGSADDVVGIRDYIAQFDSRILLVSKVEKHEAVQRLDEIIEASDAVMVARGDLGVEVPIEDVPIIQKKIISKAGAKGKPAIVATQMLNSMVESPKPTRAEASDVANAIYDGADAVMLSAETSIGRFPAESVEMMARIAQRAEESIDYDAGLGEKNRFREPSVPESVAYAACAIARDLKARAIITATESGLTARKVSKYRPSALIIACSEHQHVVNQLSLSWGVIPLRVRPAGSLDEVFNVSLEAAISAGLVRKGDIVVITAGVIVNVPGSTNVIKVLEVS